MALTFPAPAEHQFTYAALNSLVADRLNVAEHWPVPELPASPSAGETARYTEQLLQLYAAALIIGAEIPLDRLPYETATLDFPSTPVPVIVALNIPSDLYRKRPDKGIAELKIGQHRYRITDLQEYQTIEHLAHSPYLSHPVVAADEQFTTFYVIKASSLDLRYCPMFTRPADDTADTLLYPLTGADMESAIELTAAYAAGVRGADPNLQSMHYTLANLYR